MVRMSNDLSLSTLTIKFNLNIPLIGRIQQGELQTRNFYEAGESHRSLVQGVNHYLLPHRRESELW